MTIAVRFFFICSVQLLIGFSKINKQKDGEIKKFMFESDFAI
jgi:hypothetical protein